MKCIFLDKLFYKDELNRTIKKITLLIRIILGMCIFVSIGFLCIVVTTKGNIDDNSLGAFFALSTFYSFIWAAFPSLLLLIAITIDNKLRRKTSSQSIKAEAILLFINLIIILIAGTLIQIL